jgi:hypothetical protein
MLVAMTPVCAADEVGNESIGAKIIEIEGLVEAGMPGTEARVMRQGDYIEVGEEVTVRRGSMVTLALVDRSLRKFTGPTTLRIGHDPGRSGGTVVANLTAAVTDMLFETERQTSEAVMATRRVESRGELKITVPVLIHPAPGEQLLDKPREFRWMSVQGVPLYRVSIYNSSEMMWQGTISDTKATCPPRTCDFRPGETCYWVVEALVGNTTLRSEAADFTILDRDRQARLYKALEEADASVADAGMASLLKARLCTDARVFTKALEILDVHLRQSPDRSAYLLRAQIGETMGLTESAITDYKRATALPPAE